MKHMDSIYEYPFDAQIFADGGGEGEVGDAGGADGADAGRTFTQAELNTIIQKRIAQVEGKYSDYNDLKDKALKYDAAEEAAKTDLQKAQDQAKSYKQKYEELVAQNAVRDIRVKVSTEMGVPVDLLTASTEEDCKKQAASILAFAGKNPSDGYPSIKDGGESRPAGASTPEAIFDRFMRTHFK